jgi:hypothetical protein
MAEVRLTDIIEPVEFTNYVVQDSMKKSALYLSGVVAINGAIQEQLQAGAHSFSIPFWLDIADDEANYPNDDPSDNSTPHKIGTGKQIVRKSFMHNSWSHMNLASEISGDNALARIQGRVSAYWDRQLQSRLIASLKGILADNVANDSGDMVHAAGAAFSASHVIDAAGTLGDAMSALTAIAMHSDIYKKALKLDLIATAVPSEGKAIQTFRGLAIIVDDGLPVASGTYTSVLFGPGAVGVAVSAPRIAQGTEIENLPSAGNGGGQEVLHSRMNAGVHPLGFSWLETSVAGESPTLAELATATNWNRIIERKAIPLAFLTSTV